jgi:hypothetical protein
MNTEPRSVGFLLLALVSWALACSDSTGPDPVAGRYVAEGEVGELTFITHVGPSTDEVVDWLDRGAYVDLSLEGDGTAAGYLFIPGGDEDGGDLEQAFGGTWTMVDEVVKLDHEQDTFLRDLLLEREGDRLRAEEDFGDHTIRLTLVRR